MTLDVILSNRFKKDLKLAKKRGYNLDLLEEVVTELATSQTLNEKYRDHPLSGDYAGFRECLGNATSYLIGSSFTVSITKKYSYCFRAQALIQICFN